MWVFRQPESSFPFTSSDVIQIVANEPRLTRSAPLVSTKNCYQVIGLRPNDLKCSFI